MSDDVFHIFLYFPNEIENYIHSKTEAECFIESIQYLLDRADCETGAILYYSEKNLDDLIKLLHIKMEIENYGTIDIETAFNSLLCSAEICKEQGNISDCFYGLWDLDSKLIWDLDDLDSKLLLKEDFLDILKYASEKILSTELRNDKCLLVNVYNAFLMRRDFIPIFKDCRNNPDNILPKFVHIYYINNFKEMEAWFENNRIERKYNFQDNRHVENHSNYIRGKSPILDGERGKSKLAELLKTAITDQRTEEHSAKDLINYDNDKQEYVWFENEGSNNQYHGYYLVMPTTHEKDRNAINKIPDRVVNILEYRKKSSL